MSALHRWLRRIVALAVLAGLAFALYALLRARPQDLPWTRLDLSRPTGTFTGRKIAALGKDFAQCRALLDAAGVEYSMLPAVESRSGRCGYADGVRLGAGGAMGVALAPGAPVLSCPLAAGLAKWNWDVVQPAAERRFGSRVAAIEHLGSYSCRRVYGRSTGDWSEHAAANALDVAAFRLADGTRISVLRDWKGEGAKPGFLREVRRGACRLFSTVLSPDYNAAHANHLHLDEAARGAMGWRACR